MRAYGKMMMSKCNLNCIKLALNGDKMKKTMILCITFLALFIQVYPELLTTFPDMVTPIELRMDNCYIYISDQYSVFVYKKKTFKLVKKLCNKGEGPEEFRTHPGIAFAGERLILYDSYKIIIYSRDFKLIRELKLHFFADKVNPIEANYILNNFQVIDNKRYRVFALYNSQLEKIKNLVVEHEGNISNKSLINPWSRCRSWNDKAFIAQPQKGFHIEVFDKHGKKVYQIEKKMKKIKSQEKHKKLRMEEIKYFIGRARFEKARVRGVFNKPLREFVPIINNFWVVDNRIYVKTYNITDTKEKYIIMDLKGNILKTLFLPKSYMEILTFCKNKFYYLKESEDDEGWALHSLEL